MTRDEAKTILPIVQAFAEGKVVQFKGADGWSDVEEGQELGFTLSVNRYRVKSEPRVFWLNIYPRSNPCAYSSKKEADEGAGGRRVECIKVVEKVN